MLLKTKVTFIALSFVCLAGLSCRTGERANSGNANDTQERTPINHHMNDKGLQAHLPAGFELPTDEVGQRLLKEYGAIFVVRGATAPPAVIFKNETEVSRWQMSVAAAKENIGGTEIELQAPAMKALKDAVDEAAKGGLTITPRGNDAARRSYGDTIGLWASRVEPGLRHWVQAGKITQEEADSIHSLSAFEQVPKIFALEDKGIFFSKDLSKPIIYSVAPPGASQHLSMLALDVTEFDNAKVREILARHGWFQTVVSDLPHFTYLGADEKDLPDLGLKQVTNAGRTFWIPAG
jgi:hypothetical protein